jgi:hypothetical protein
LHKYLVCLIYALVINKGRNVMPLTTLQTIVDTLSTMLSIAVYGHILGGFKEVKFEMAE